MVVADLVAGTLAGFGICAVGASLRRCGAVADPSRKRPLVTAPLPAARRAPAGHPFDTLKVLMQMQPDKYTSMASAARETVSKHGLGGLYKGVGAPLIGNGFYNAIQFAIFSRAKAWFTDDGRNAALYRIGAAGAFTGVFVALVEGVRRGAGLLGQ
jgi:hypothetical protein